MSFGTFASVFGPDLQALLVPCVIWVPPPPYRIQTYLQSTRPIIELYEKQGKVRYVDASHSVAEVSVLGTTALGKRVEGSSTPG